MQIRRLRNVHGQLGILGQIINAPVSVNTMAYRLKCNVDDDYCVNVCIKRRKIHRTSELMEKYLRIAPTEANVPRSLLFDEHLRSSPSQQFTWVILETSGKKLVTPFMRATSELRLVDRHGVTPQPLLYMAIKIIRLRVRDSLTVAFKHVGKKANNIRQQIGSEEYINGCIENNLAFLRGIPNSTWYW
ncbi:helitron_like_N domain-containing protein [Trichonephila clavipes]|nr:helitron_like_N domain-containing protein [Trichonephila clavipes]